MHTSLYPDLDVTEQEAVFAGKFDAPSPRRQNAAAIAWTQLRTV